jgi:hypothetical protein
VQGLLAARWFGESEGFSDKKLFDIGVAPTFAVSPEIQILGRAMYTLGSFSGIEAGIGVHLTF